MARLISITTAPGVLHRRRAGLAFGPEAVLLPPDMLDAATLAQLEADPMLLVGEVEVGSVIEPAPEPAIEPVIEPAPEPVIEPAPEPGQPEAPPPAEQTDKPAGRKAKA